MNMNETPHSDRYTVGLFGRRNAGKSTLINAVTAQNIALTSDVAGTTTDPVKKAMELLPIGPVLIIDTAGLDDVGELGEKRVQKSYQALRQCDLAVLVCDASLGSDAFSSFERRFIETLRLREIDCLIVLNKCGDEQGLLDMRAYADAIAAESGHDVVCADAITGLGTAETKRHIIKAWKRRRAEREVGLTDGIVAAGDLTVLVTPIDSAAPKGRLILPQQQVLRDIIDKGAYSLVVRATELAVALRTLALPPAVVITDSQAFKSVASDVPRDVPLTSFSILFSRQKGDIERQLSGIAALRELEEGDRVLISEGCTHHRQCGDIGRDKIPAMLGRIRTDLNLSWTSGTEFPDDLSKYKLILHCGGCMLNRNEMQYRINRAAELGVPITNYGMFIAYHTGILERALEPFGLSVKSQEK